MAAATKKARKTSANGNNGSKWIRPERRLALYLRDRFACIYSPRALHDAAPRDITLDHIDGRHEAGHHTNENLITCCRSCNSKKQDIPLKRFAGPETIAHIRRNTKRSMTKYMRLAKALISGETGFEDTIKALD